MCKRGGSNPSLNAAEEGLDSGSPTSQVNALFLYHWLFCCLTHTFKLDQRFLGFRASSQNELCWISSNFCVSWISFFSCSSQAWVHSDIVTLKVGAQFTAYCSWETAEHPLPSVQLWEWEGVVLLYMNFHVDDSLPPSPKLLLCVVVNVTTFLTNVKRVPVDLNQHA